MEEHHMELIATAQNTQILRSPRNVLTTFGNTRIHYYILTDPVYKGLLDNSDDTVLREGYVIAEKPRIITPNYLRNIFQGFEHGSVYARHLIEAYGPCEPGIMYQYSNDFKSMEVVTTPLEEVARKLGEDLDRENEPFAAVIKGDRKLWDVSLMLFIYSFTGQSLKSNLSELGSLGMLSVDRSGVTGESRFHIERLFREVESGKTDPSLLKKELDAWGVFEEYEDRFLDLFRKKE
ncbi:MAG: hypothetical protein RDV48_09760 [Candidatus Eremiobacteraeota bacterium]|nr:hypothetical protein [Candidatus Eremiobacteraeota bacterium]